MCVCIAKVELTFPGGRRDRDPRESPGLGERQRRAEGRAELLSWTAARPEILKGRGIPFEVRRVFGARSELQGRAFVKSDAARPDKGAVECDSALEED